MYVLIRSLLSLRGDCNCTFKASAKTITIRKVAAAAAAAAENRESRAVHGVASDAGDNHGFIIGSFPFFESLPVFLSPRNDESY